MAGTHLYHGNLVLGIEAEQRLGYAHIVVEIALGGHHIILLCKHGANEFLGGGLAIGASDAYHGHAELAAMLARKVLESLQ